MRRFLRTKVGATLAAAVLGGGMYAGAVVLSASNAKDNLFAVASGGSPNCAPSASKITFSQAQSVNAVCGPGTGNAGYATNGIDNACAVAAGGYSIGVKSGSYSRNSDGSILEWGDCSHGAGADVNPNCAVQQALNPGSCASTGNTNNWVTIQCADNPCNVTWPAASLKFLYHYFHVIWKVPIPLNGIWIGYGGEGIGQQPGEIQFVGNSATDRLRLYGVQVLGAKDVAFVHINNGMSYQCAYNGANTPVSLRCNPNGPNFEAAYANNGPSSAGCSANNTGICGGYFSLGGGEGFGWSETYVHPNGAYSYQNILFQDFVDHDNNGPVSGSGVHPGCLLETGNGISTQANAVFDHYVCERISGQGFSIADSGNLVQNSVISCTVNMTGDAGGSWDSCANGSAAAGLACIGTCTVSNDVFRFNTIIGTASQSPLVTQDGSVTNESSYGSHSNDVIVGNLFLGSAPECNGAAGITFDRNAYGNGISTCGTNAVSLAAGNPLVNSSPSTPGDTYYAKGGIIDPHLTGSPSVPTFDASALSAVYQLDHDCDGKARTLASMRYGACN